MYDLTPAKSCARSAAHTNCTMTSTHRERALGRVVDLNGGERAASSYVTRQASSNSCAWNQSLTRSHIENEQVDVCGKSTRAMPTSGNTCLGDRATRPHVVSSLAGSASRSIGIRRNMDVIRQFIAGKAQSTKAQGTEAGRQGTIIRTRGSRIRPRGLRLRSRQQAQRREREQ